MYKHNIQIILQNIYVMVLHFMHTLLNMHIHRYATHTHTRRTESTASSVVAETGTPEG